MNVLLDTHVVLWWQAGGERLSRKSRHTIADADELLVSPLTCWEVATLARLGRIQLDRDPTTWVRALLRLDRTALAPLTAEAAAWAGALSDAFPGDPIDRLLVATARDHRVPLISKDERLRTFARTIQDVEIIW
ncbi:MAG TPA: type II toxin-antitoxin system VapC family toxin [Candidatus Limnocylindrales bacterium]